MTDRRERGDVLALMLKMAASPEGLTNASLAEKLDTAQSNIAPRINAACARGHIFRSQRQGFKLHWFDTAERAQEWASLPPPHKPKKLTAPVQKPIQKPLQKKAGPPALTTYHAEKHTAGASKLKALKAGAPVDASGAKFTKCPSGLDHRFVAIPEETPAIFAAKGGGLGVGRYLQEVAA